MRFTRIMPALSVLLLPALLASPASAQALTSSPGPRPATATPTQHFGPNCVTIRSPRSGIKGTICAIVNQDDAHDPFTYEQALITFSVTRGFIEEVSATDLYLKACTTHSVCTEENYEASPSKGPGTRVKNTFLSNAFFNATQAVKTVQAIVNKPCIEWSNGQKGCYHKTLESEVHTFG